MRISEQEIKLLKSLHARHLARTIKFFSSAQGSMTGKKLETLIFLLPAIKNPKHQNRFKMNPFFKYLMKSTINLSLLYLLFKVCMRNDKTLVLNQFLLLGILFVSAVIPLVDFQLFHTEVPAKQVEILREFIKHPLFVVAETPVATPMISQPIKSEINYWMWIYGTAIFILIIQLFVSVGKVLQLIQKAEK